MIRQIVSFLFYLGFTISHGQILPADYQLDNYVPLLKGKRVGLVVNHTAQIANRHLADTLLTLGVEISAVFSPEHGFRGKISAGDTISDEMTDRFPVFSLYGKNKKPTPNQLALCDLLVFDMQDVGTRFYTYISTLHYVMEACAAANKPLIILDRPNPNGHFIDGPVLDTAFRSFVGLHPIPVVHGLTIGELGQMILGEKWIENPTSWTQLIVVSMKNYAHHMPYILPVPPSPNLPNEIAISWYPLLCFFEGTTLSVGRGTPFPFQVIGHPEYKNQNFTFIPLSNQSASSPPHENKRCFGIRFEDKNSCNYLDLEWIISAYSYFKENNLKFFTSYFDTLAGTDALRMAIENGASAEKIRNSWQRELNAYKSLRKKYLIYPD